MARTKKPERTIQKNIAIPEDICARMELELYSPLEGRIPFGAQQELIVSLLRAHYRILQVKTRMAEKSDAADAKFTNILTGETS